MSYSLFKNIAFALDAEKAHDLALSFFHHFPHASSLIRNKTSDYDLSLKVGRSTWKFPVGLAAGLDKNATCLNFFDSIGFGALEVGTVTPFAQEGNHKPRLFRYPKELSIRNCMGFNNFGASFLKERIQEYKTPKVPIGINIGKNKVTKNKDAYKDYLYLYNTFKDTCDYMVINVSSPNTPGLRENQTKEALEEILLSLNHKASEIDLYVKIAPDIDLNSVDDVLELVSKYNLRGVIATNTTIIPEMGLGGVSGKLLYYKAKSIRDYILEKLSEHPEVELIGVGGFSDYEHIVDFWKKGGRALQIYTSFIYQGPVLLATIQENIEADLKHLNLSSVEELINHYRGLV